MLMSLSLSLPSSSFSSLPLTILWFAALIGQGALIKHDPSPLLQSDSSDPLSESRQNNYVHNFQQQYQQPQINSNPYFRPQTPQNVQNYAYRPEFNRYPSQPSRYPPQLGQNFFGASQQQSFMDILETVAANDELQCVAKILCEMSAGRRQTSSSSSQQSFVNLESLLTLLSSVDDTTASPLVKFGKAFIVGYSSKHISQCHYAYPKCPSDPDRLIHYLNNQNGGIFRFFNGNNRRIQNYNPRDLFQNIYNMYNPTENQITSFLNNPPYVQNNQNSQNNGDSIYSPSHEQILQFLHDSHNTQNAQNADNSQTFDNFRTRRGKSVKFPAEILVNKDPYFPFYFPESSNNEQLDTDNTIVFKYTK